MKRVFSSEFKLMVIGLIEEKKKSVSEVSKFFDIDRQVIHLWLKKYREKGEEYFCTENVLGVNEVEFKKLEREKHTLQEDNEILKKALAYFGKTNKKKEKK